MVMVKLKMRTIYKTLLFLISFLILLIIGIGGMYFFYDKFTTIESDIEVYGNLSVNYITGKKIDVKDILVMEFSVTNGGDEISYYNINFSRVRGNGNYKLYKKNILISEGELKTIDEISTDYLSIDINETKDYRLEIKNSGEFNLKGILNVRLHNTSSPTFADIILEDNIVSLNPLTEVGIDVAKENEGLIKSNDDMGISYYFRGNVDNNYVLFGNMIWRIVRINGDGTVRLVLDSVADTLSSYYLTDKFVRKYDESNINIYLKDWFKLNLNEYNDYIANSRYCSDITYNEDYSFQAYDRIVTNKIPTFNCLGDRIITNIGLLTIDEVVLAGASTTSYNRDFYLYNSSIKETWYTMTAVKGDNTSMNMFMIDSSGNINLTTNANLYRNVRPVINLVKNIEMTGDGTKSNPYILKK